jgi:hypothetical protein
MRSVCLPVRAIFLATGIIFVSSSAGAQHLGYGSGDGHFSYDWSNIGAVGQGDTVVVRRVLIGTGDRPVAVQAQVCGIELVASAAIQAVSQKCSDAKAMLEPGDSIWMEQRWVVESEPGRYEFELRSLTESGYLDYVFSAGTWQVQDLEGRRAEVKPPNRLPAVIRTTVAEGGAERFVREIESVVGHVLHRAGYLPVLVSPVAAGSMEGLARRLELTVELGPENRFGFGACWFDRHGSPMDGECDLSQRGGASPMMLGVLLRDFVQREMDRVARWTN